MNTTWADASHLYRLQFHCIYGTLVVCWMQLIIAWILAKFMLEYHATLSYIDWYIMLILAVAGLLLYLHIRCRCPNRFILVHFIREYFSPEYRQNAVWQLWCLDKLHKCGALKLNRVLLHRVVRTSFLTCSMNPIYYIKGIFLVVCISTAFVGHLWIRWHQYQSCMFNKSGVC